MCLATVPYTQKHQKSRGLAPLRGGEGQQRTQRGCSAAGCSNHCGWAVCSWEGSSPPRGITLKACLKGRLGSRSENMLNSLCEAEDEKGKKKKGPFFLHQNCGWRCLSDRRAAFVQHGFMPYSNVFEGGEK